jgi:hypothetical protein
MRPFRYPLHVTMFHGVDMAVIDMSSIVPLVADRMLPETPLAESPLHPHRVGRAAFGPASLPANFVGARVLAQLASKAEANRPLRGPGFRWRCILGAPSGHGPCARLSGTRPWHWLSPRAMRTAERRPPKRQRTRERLPNEAPSIGNVVIYDSRCALNRKHSAQYAHAIAPCACC